MMIESDLVLLFTGLCDIFNKSRFDYCVAGGFAVGMWGPPRGTSDIDILIFLRETDRDSLMTLLGNHFNVLQSHDEDMVFGDLHIWRHILTGENKKNIFPLDMLIASNEYLQNVIKRRIEIEYRGVSVPVISVEDLIILKAVSFRDIDRFDMGNLVNGEVPIDWSYLEKMAGQLVQPRQLDFLKVLKQKGVSSRD